MSCGSVGVRTICPVLGRWGARSVVRASTGGRDTEGGLPGLEGAHRLGEGAGAAVVVGEDGVAEGPGDGELRIVPAAANFLRRVVGLALDADPEPPDREVQTVQHPPGPAPPPRALPFRPA